MLTFQHSQCCGHYGSKGTATLGGYDCVLLPGAMTKSSAIKYPAMCGGVGGLVTATSTIAKTLCSKYHFNQIQYYCQLTVCTVTENDCLTDFRE